MDRTNSSPPQQYLPHQNYPQFGPDGRPVYAPLEIGPSIQAQEHPNIPIMSITNSMPELYEIKISRDRWASWVRFGSSFMMVISLLWFALIIFHLFNLDEQAPNTLRWLILRTFISSAMFFVSWIGLKASKTKDARHSKMYFKSLVLFISGVIICIAISYTITHSYSAKGSYYKINSTNEIKDEKGGHYNKNDHNKKNIIENQFEEYKDFNVEFLQDKEYESDSTDMSISPKSNAISFVSPDDFFGIKPYWHEGKFLEKIFDFPFSDFDDVKEDNEGPYYPDDPDDFEEEDLDEDSDDIIESTKRSSTRAAKTKGHKKDNKESHKHRKNQRKQGHLRKHIGRHSLAGGVLGTLIAFSVVMSFVLCAYKLYKASSHYDAMAYHNLPIERNYVQPLAAQPYGAVPANNVGYYPHLAPVGTAVQ